MPVIQEQTPSAPVWRPSDANAARVSCLPDVDVIVAFRNEAALIASKVRNLRRLDYPNLRFFMVDGASSDRSEQIGRAAAGGDNRFRWLSSSEAGKTHQLNLAWQRCSAPWVLLTDADARLPRATVRRFVALGESNLKVGLIGTACRPQRPSTIDRTHWRSWNAVRRFESRWGAVTALGPCYAIRRAAFNGWPDDVVADDVFASLEINRAGLRCELAALDVVERRAPVGVRAFLWHKVRKVRAVLLEVRRFLPRYCEFRGAPRHFLVARAFGLLVVPWLVIAGLSAALVASPAFAAVICAVVASSFLMPAEWRLLRLVTAPFRAIGLVVILSFVLVAATVTLSVARPRAVFCRWKLEET